MTDPIERIRQIVERHGRDDSDAATAGACGCGADALSDHSRHVAEEIVERLGLRPEKISNVKNAIRYVSAWFDEELTTLEGAD